MNSVVLFPLVFLALPPFRDQITSAVSNHFKTGTQEPKSRKKSGSSQFKLEKEVERFK